MRISALILMSSLPAAWVAVGCLLLLLAVVMTILFLLKAREVSTLKKQCEELRDTMRMMRYEEANLARMLHTASKSVGPIEMVTEENVEVTPEENVNGLESLESLGCLEEPQKLQEEPQEQEQQELQEQESQEQGQQELQGQELQGQQEQQELQKQQEQEIEPQELQEQQESQEQSVVNNIEESQVIAPQKQPISERRSALPVDLFSAWFAENEEEQGETLTIYKEEKVGEPKPVIAATIQKESIAVAEEPIATEKTTIVEEPAAEEFLSSEESVMSEEPAAMLVVEELEEAGERLQETELNKEDERFCRKLERIVTNRMRNPNLNIDIIAAQFGIGRTNFYRKVREVMGMSPNDYLRKCRMERAAELLRSTDAPVSEVCAQVGMPDAQYFSRVFKTFYGTSPSIYRENNNQ